MSVSLNGNLRDFGIAEVFQLIGQQRKTGLLEIEGESHTIRLAFDEGAVVWASPVGPSEFAELGERLVRCGLITRNCLDDLARESEASARPLPELLVGSKAVRQDQLEEISDLLSHETIFEVMRWTGGSFHFSAQQVHHSRPAEKLLSAEQILMDGLRMLDEWQTLTQWVPSEETVFRRMGQLEECRRKQAREGRLGEGGSDSVLQLVDGRLPVRRIVDLSRLGTFEATRILAELRQSGMIEPLDEQLVASARRARGQNRPVTERLRWGFAAALPMALLALVAFGGLPEHSLSERNEGIAIAREPLLAVQSSFARRRLHNRLEAQRFLTGSWPDDLSEPGAWQGADETELAADSLRPYYYRKRDDGYVLLAPRR